MSQMTLTIDTKDTKVVREAAEMLLRLSGSVPLEFSPVLESTRVGTSGDFTPPEVWESSAQVTRAINNMVSTPDVPVDIASAFGGTDINPLGATVSEDGSVSFGDTETVTLDAAGLPWDARIHSSSKERIANGTWKIKRGVDRNLVAQFQAEYLGKSPTPISEPTVTPKVEVTDNVPPPPPPPPPPFQLPSDTAGTAPATYAELMQRVVQSKTPIASVQVEASKLGLASFALLAQRTDLIPAVAEALGL